MTIHSSSTRRAPRVLTIRFPRPWISNVVLAVALATSLAACASDTPLGPDSPRTLDAHATQATDASLDSPLVIDRPGALQLPAPSEDASREDRFLERAHRVLRAFEGPTPVVRIDVLRQQLRRLPLAEREEHLTSVAFELGRRCAYDHVELGPAQLAHRLKLQFVIERAVIEQSLGIRDFGLSYMHHAEVVEADIPENLQDTDLQTQYEGWVEQGIHVPIAIDASMVDLDMMGAQLSSMMAMVQQMAMNSLSLGSSIVVGAGVGAAGGALSGPGALAGGAVGAVTGAVGWFLTELAEASEAGSRDDDGDGIENRFDTDMDGDGTPNSEDDDRDGDGVPNDEDEYPDDKEKSITAESEGGWYLMAGATDIASQFSYVHDYRQDVMAPLILELVTLHY